MVGQNRLGYNALNNPQICNNERYFSHILHEQCSFVLCSNSGTQDDRMFTSHSVIICTYDLLWEQEKRWLVLTLLFCFQLVLSIAQSIHLNNYDSTQMKREVDFWGDRWNTGCAYFFLHRLALLLSSVI